MSSRILAVLLVLLGACTSRPAEVEPTPSVPSDPSPPATSPAAVVQGFQEFPVPTGSRPHDVAPAADGGVWYTAQGSGDLGYLDVSSGQTRHIELGQGAAPHGVIVGPDGTPWITDGGLNAIVKVDQNTDKVTAFPVPRRSANLNTAAFSGDGMLWFTGQAGIYGVLNPATGEIQVFDAPKGRGPYGISSTPSGEVWFSSLAGSYIARIGAGGQAEIFEPTTANAGARRVWSDSMGKLWVTQWFAGNLAQFDPQTRRWEEFRMPGDKPQPYAVYVDENDTVWVSDFGSNSLIVFDPTTRQFQSHAFPSPGAQVRQLLGRPTEVWGAESGTDKLVVFRTSPR